MKYIFGMKSIRVLIAGQKYFAAEVFNSLMNKEGVEVAAVCCPVGGEKNDRLYNRAMRFNIQVIPSGTLNADTMPEDIDLGIAAHSFDFIGKATRYKARLGWIGYHPSLLPRHRGRDSVRWAVKMGDPITGGTVYWLNGGVDRGGIQCQDWCFISPGETATELWREKLCPMGVKLITKAVNDILKGNIIKTPQDERCATFEPAMGAQPIYRPDLLMLSYSSHKKVHSQMSRRKAPERENDLVFIADLYVKNNSVRTIADKLAEVRDYKVSFKTVANDIQEILKRWQEKKDDMITKHVAIELEKSLIREREIWEAWEKSKTQTKSKTTKKKGTKNGPDSIEIQEDEDENIGYYKYIQEMRKEADFRCRLLGSFAAINVNNNVKTDGAVIILPSNGRDNNDGN